RDTQRCLVGSEMCIRDRESGIKIPLPADVLANSPPVPAPRIALSAASLGIDASFVDLRLGFPRPPNLYLKHHSFLI
ncbi:MAG: hypothetical protein QUS14_07315, partial [Pyrinomonadaceae bacterium]|nr:hypothetical protein [Pyrinomonadaceae bacterium]